MHRYSLTKASYYALRALVWLVHNPDRRSMTSQEIAAETGLPDKFLLKVLKPLAQHGILASVRGPGGGYRVGRDPRGVTVLDVVDAVEGGPVFNWLSHEKDGAVATRLAALVDQASAAGRERMAKVTVAALAKE